MWGRYSERCERGNGPAALGYVQNLSSNRARSRSDTPLHFLEQPRLPLGIFAENLFVPAYHDVQTVCGADRRRIREAESLAESRIV
jgi:hypothetical protein